MIPKICHFVWFGREPTKRDLYNIDVFRKHHPDWHIILWTDQDKEDLGHYETRNFNEVPILFPPKMWNKPLGPSEASNLLRMEVVFHLGGLYIDSDMITFRNCEHLFQEDQFLYVHKDQKHWINNGLIAGSPGNSLILTMVDCMIRESEKVNYKGSHFSRTGPPSISKKVIFDNHLLRVLGFPEVLVPWNRSRINTNKRVFFHDFKGRWMGQKAISVVRCEIDRFKEL